MKKLSEQKEKMKKLKQKGRIWESVTAWTVFAIVCVSLCVLYATYQIVGYEAGVISIYARQQDAYVQLVLDQININKEEKSENAILEIIGTLDSSTNKYWTLSHDETIIFVKDVTETNRYKGFTTETYYYSDTAQEFLETLTVNRVMHGQITVNDKEYIASGVKFQYQDENYQICLLTNPEVVLEQNEYLSARVNLSVMIAAVMTVFLITIIAMGRMINKKDGELQREREDNFNLNRMVEQLNQELNAGDMYDVRKSLFHKDFLPMLYTKLQARKISPVTFMVLEYDSQEEKEFFLTDASLMMDRRIMRFGDNSSKHIILALVQYDELEARKAIEWILSVKLRAVAMLCVNNVEEYTCEQIMERLFEGVTGNEK